MTSDELKAAQRTLGLNIPQLAVRLRCSNRAIESWRMGVNQIPGPVAVAIEMMLKEAGQGATPCE
jgi:DNA-binding transcriptional regulator YiaG